MVVDDDTALILGREVLGFPKKMAEIELDSESRPMVGTVRRKGGEVLRIEFEPEGEEADPAPVFARRFVNACGTLIHGLDLIEIPAGGERIHRSLKGQGKALPMDGPRDQLGAFRPTGDVTVRYVELDFGGGGSGGAPRVVAKADPAWAGTQFMSRAF
ncbi:MAG: hypothetical protein KatS3mg008_2194 [Acidimicrobiales bacterium]|nr:MAG: hypothetical protein KatS3mg008_2194 [Acidimicrobiales bacterium]